MILHLDLLGKPKCRILTHDGDAAVETKGCRILDGRQQRAGVPLGSNGHSATLPRTCWATATYAHQRPRRSDARKPAKPAAAAGEDPSGFIFERRIVFMISHSACPGDDQCEPAATQLMIKLKLSGPDSFLLRPCVDSNAFSNRPPKPEIVGPRPRSSSPRRRNQHNAEATHSPVFSFSFFFFIRIKVIRRRSATKSCRPNTVLDQFSLPKSRQYHGP